MNGSPRTLSESHQKENRPRCSWFNLNLFSQHARISIKNVCKFKLKFMFAGSDFKVKNCVWGRGLLMLFRVYVHCSWLHCWDNPEVVILRLTIAQSLWIFFTWIACRRGGQMLCEHNEIAVGEVHQQCFRETLVRTNVCLPSLTTASGSPLPPSICG